jgi:hypothetical protein
MSIYKLCPFCQNNGTCKSPVPIKIVHDLHGEGESLIVSLMGELEKRSVCHVIQEALKEAIKSELAAITFLVPPGITLEATAMLGSVINCRVILHLNHEARAPKLKEIRVYCNEIQEDHMKEGLSHSHPLCINCFEICRAQLPEQAS